VLVLPAQISGASRADDGESLSVALLRLRGDYFAVGSLAAAIALQAFVLNWAWAGGATGIILPVDVPLGIDLFRLAVVVTALALASSLYVARSRFGLRLTAVRDNEPAASGLGVSVYRHRLGPWSYPAFSPHLRARSSPTSRAPSRRTACSG
jgi:ABC-type branched-subunit amino acid transport system permease subunit